MAHILETFLHNYLDTSAVADAKELPLDKFEHNIYGVEGFHSYVQYRDEEFQVQVFLFPPFAIAPEHTHPNVHSYEVGLSGDLWFSHVHGASIGPKGGMFLSVQQWLNGVKPSCVGKDYDGYGVSPEQTKYDGVKYKKLDWKMAASKETRKPPWG